ncbi:flavin reductase family protein [Paenarthrobacter sp. PH39-S1]|uniref:flavin reductase family protein n=1 Tax=Paenarthrobacter sp. PH39-S1 TaxID=3046204 RepID=UPI0024BAEEF0|nr:flavin reductase family protein [Paenarthrobacter sp. PH39-S1]MDJ0358290.1 flavin reductase family protein [Paenarthrobacter sp. PH39-S1]
MSKDIDSALFRETLGHYPTGVAVVTAVAEDGKPVGMIVGTFSSVSMNPPLIAFYPMNSSRSFAQVRTAKAFCVNVLASDQEPFCRRFASAGEKKFDGVGWRPGPLGSPILDGAVSWIECTFEDVRDAGDHYIVLGRVEDLAVERSTLPLLFFQGGYGKFSPGSFIAAPDPELIQAAHVAETMRTRVEELSVEFGVNCSVLARIRWDAVQVLAVNHSPIEEPFPLGHRQPLIPPFGAVFMAHSPDSDIDEWLGRGPDLGDERRDLNRAQLNRVRECGYSLLAAGPEVLQRHAAVLSAFEQSDRLPRQQRVVQEATSELADFFFTDLIAGGRYDLANIVVLVTTREGMPPMALRMTGLPSGASTEQIKSSIDALKKIAS